MIRSLRRKFVAINMTLLMIVFTVLLCIIYTTTAANIEDEAKKYRKKVLEMAQTMEEHPEEDDDSDDRENRGPVDMHMWTTYLLRKTPEQTWNIGGPHPDDMDSHIVVELADLIMKQEKDDGKINYRDTSFSYIRWQTERGNQYIVLQDRSNDVYRLQSLLWKLILVGAVGAIAFWGISVLLARWAVRPIARVLEQQRHFVADASHELKTPLSVIMANASLVLSHPEKSVAEERKWLEYIQEEGERMNGLVTSLLYLARSDDGSLQKVYEPVCFSDIVEEELLHLEPLIFEAGKNLIQEIESDLWMYGDSSQLKRMVQNLLENAIKYSEERGQIRIELTKQRERLQFVVFNTGRTLTQDQMKHIFERFYRVDEARDRSAGGYGLGLSIVQAIVHEHKGKIIVQSQEGEGTWFTVTFPLWRGAKE